LNQAIIIAAMAFTQACVVALIGGMFNRESKKKREDQSRADNRAEIRAKEGLLSMRLVSANMNLAIAIAVAVQEGKTNGKMAAALIEAEKAQQEYYDFINSVATSHIKK